MTIDERGVTAALRTYARDIELTDADLARLETRLTERVHPTPRRDRGRRPWEWAVAACAVVALVLAVAALWRTRADEIVPASPTIAPADLAGLFLLDFEGDDRVWQFTADGRLSISTTASAYVNRYHQTTFTVEGDVLSFEYQGVPCRSTVRLSAEGRLTLVPVLGPTRCSLWDPGDGEYFPLVRVSPASLPGAMLTVRNADRQRPPAEAESGADLAGTWLLKGTGTTLAVVRTTAGIWRYVIDDDGDGQVDPDQRGVVSVRPDGGIVLRPEGGAGQDCDTVYARVVTTGTTLEADVADDSCSRIGAVRDTWIRLN